MVEKITKEERKVSLAIEKAKEVIQAFQDGTTVEMEGDLQGEEVKLKSPKKNPAEEKVVNPVGKEEGYGYVGKQLEESRERKDDDWNPEQGEEQLVAANDDRENLTAQLEDLNVELDDLRQMTRRNPGAVGHEDWQREYDYKKRQIDNIHIAISRSDEIIKTPVTKEIVKILRKK